MYCSAWCAAKAHQSPGPATPQGKVVGQKFIIIIYIYIYISIIIYIYIYIHIHTCIHTYIHAYIS